jgi:hypothetical protein
MKTCDTAPRMEALLSLKLRNQVIGLFRNRSHGDCESRAGLRVADGRRYNPRDPVGFSGMEFYPPVLAL